MNFQIQEQGHLSDFYGGKDLMLRNWWRGMTTYDGRSRKWISATTSKRLRGRCSHTDHIINPSEDRVAEGNNKISSWSAIIETCKWCLLHNANLQVGFKGNSFTDIDYLRLGVGVLPLFFLVQWCHQPITSNWVTFSSANTFICGDPFRITSCHKIYINDPDKVSWMSTSMTCTKW